MFIVSYQKQEILIDSDINSCSKLSPLIKSPLQQTLCIFSDTAPDFQDLINKDDIRLSNTLIKDDIVQILWFMIKKKPMSSSNYYKP